MASSIPEKCLLYKQAREPPGNRPTGGEPFFAGVGEPRAQIRSAIHVGLSEGRGVGASVAQVAHNSQELDQ